MIVKEIIFHTSVTAIQEVWRIGMRAMTSQEGVRKHANDGIN